MTEIYNLQNIINNYYYTSSKDKKYIRLVEKQDELLKSLPEEERSEVIENLLHGKYPKTNVSKLNMNKIMSDILPDVFVPLFQPKNPNPRKLPVLLPPVEKPLPLEIRKQILVEERRSEEEFRRANGLDD